MQNIELPSEFKKTLKNPTYLGIIHSTIADFSEIYRDNKLFFFEEYTDHGIQHIQDVLSSAEAIIADESFSELSEEDILVLILAILLHDIGMHISFDGFKLLLDGRFDDVKTNLDDNTWKNLWNNFITESKRFSEKQIKGIFGEHIEKGFVIREPDLANKDSLNGIDKKLIGEFIRRYHHRLAHEIALKGFPGKEIISFANNTENKYKDLAGLVARSHGMDVRDTFDYLKTISNKSWKNLYNVKPIYLMIIIRISDLIQIQSNRASQIILKVRSLSSPISLMEWGAHHAIQNINLKMDDPELIHVDANPLSSKEFLKLKNLFNYIQYELDISWAILGEVYSYNGKHKELKLRYRRITSNLQDKNIKIRFNFVPEKIIYDADPELLKLLIAPLYGDSPTYGVRELMQNALDACLERKHAIKKQYGEDSTEYNQYIPRVDIAINKESEDKYSFIIQDNGIGMNEDIIKNFFLKAGASYRNSGLWQKQFSDEEGKSQVLRSGRFGVGVLAAFLLGNTINIQTKRINSEFGFRFNINIDSEQIEVVKKEVLPLGTKIVIELSSDSISKLCSHFSDDDFKKYNFEEWVRIESKKSYDGETSFFEWYYLESPQVSFKIGQIELKINPTIPTENKFDNEWHEIKPNDFDKVFWTFNKPEALTCNGILIPDSYEIENYYKYPYLPINLNHYKFPIFRDLPFLAIFDSQSKLPLSLDRSRLIDNLPFEEELKTDVLKDLIAKYLTIATTRLPRITNEQIIICPNKIIHKLFHNIKHPSYNYKDGNFLMFKSNGYFIEELNISNTTISSEILIYARQAIVVDNFIKDTSIPIKLRCSEREFLVHEEFLEIKSLFYLNSLNSDRVSARVYLRRHHFDYLFDENSTNIKGYYKYAKTIEYQNDQWVCFTYNNPPESNINKDKLEDLVNSKNSESIIPCVFERYMPESYIHASSLSFDDVLLKLINELLSSDDITIPYDLEDRKNKFPKAFKELASYMEKYLNLSEE